LNLSLKIQIYASALNQVNPVNPSLSKKRSHPLKGPAQKNMLLPCQITGCFALRVKTSCAGTAICFVPAIFIVGCRRYSAPVFYMVQGMSSILHNNVSQKYGAQFLDLADQIIVDWIVGLGRMVIIETKIIFIFTY